MSYTIDISESAEADLREIFEYIGMTLQSLGNAASQLNRLETAIMSLGEMPERFRRYDKEPWFSRGLHMMPVDNYLVFYLVNKELVNVTIIRVFYSSRNIDEHLGKK